MENLNFFLYDLLPKFLLGGVICIVAFGLIHLIAEYIDQIIPIVWIAFGVVMLGWVLVLLPIIFYTIGDYIINGTFWELIESV